MEILKVLLIMIVSIMISGVESYLIYRWLLDANYTKQQNNPFAHIENALIGAAISGIVLASINTSVMFWLYIM